MVHVLVVSIFNPDPERLRRSMELVLRNHYNERRIDDLGVTTLYTRRLRLQFEPSDLYLDRCLAYRKMFE